ncbi:hypothetical protein [Sphingomonas sp.]|uniref:hypothetical protein n=1 Tax=Sphingomonas sp. TaxID=28214 RepID=UPI00286DFCB5|nr:hypothetical protein [Sphingomonas sp.]
MRAAAFAGLIALTSAAPAAAEPVRKPLDLSIPRTAFDDDGAAAKRRGVIAGVELAPDAAVGFGVFNAAPKPSLSTSDEKLFGGPRKSRKAGVGLSLKF